MYYANDTIKLLQLITKSIFKILQNLVDKNLL